MQTKECRQTRKDDKGEETESLLRDLRRNQPCQLIEPSEANFGFLTSGTVREATGVVAERGDVSRKPKETNTPGSSSLSPALLEPYMPDLF